MPILEYLNNQIPHLKKQIIEAQKKPDNKNVHQLRVSIRRIHSSLWLAHHSANHLSFSKSFLSLHKMTKALGKQRDLDVAFEGAKHFHLRTDKITAHRKSIQKKLYHQLNSKHRKKLLHRLQQSIKKLNQHKDLNFQPGVLTLKKRLNFWLQKKSMTHKDLHKLRITIKKTRYILSVAGRPVEPLKNLQDILGKGHDLEVLQEISKSNPALLETANAEFIKAKSQIRPALLFALKQLDHASFHLRATNP